MESREDCLHEASECDRLAELANTRGYSTQALLAAWIPTAVPGMQILIALPWKYHSHQAQMSSIL
jgi:hypothetical protein